MVVVAVWQILRLVCFVLLGFHLGMSWWLLALLVVALQLEYEPV
jgi:hypothetical protein